MTLGTAQKCGQSKTPQTKNLSLDRLEGLLRQEEAYSIASTYIPEDFSDEVVENYAKWRYTMVEWFQELIDSFQYEPETLEVAVSILDRYVAAKPDKLMKNSREYKMAALTSLYIAAKMYEPICMTPDHAYDLSFEIHMAEMTIEEEELDILHTIGWKANPPTPTAFLREFVATIQSDFFHLPEDKIMEMVRPELDRMLCEEIFVTDKSSMLALTALYNAITSYLHTDEIPELVEARLFSALGLYSNETEAYESIDRLRDLISSISALRSGLENWDYENEEGPEDDEIPPPPKEEDSIDSSSPRSTISKRLSC